MGLRFLPDCETFAFYNKELKSKCLEGNTEKNDELLYILLNQCILYASQEVSQLIGIVLSSGPRVVLSPCCVAWQLYLLGYHRDCLFQRDLIWKVVQSWL
jgi:hypothetical protein